MLPLPLPNRFSEDLHRFLAWWTGELAALVPTALRRILLPWRTVLMIDMDDTGAVFRLRRGSAVRELGRILDADIPTNHSAAQSLLRKVDLKRTFVLLRLPADLALCRTLSLPAAVAENLRGVLGFEMDRLTPFRADDVAFDYRVIGYDTRMRQIKISLVLVPRRMMEEALRRAEGWGLPRPAAIGLSGDYSLADDDINFLADPEPARSRLPGRTVALGALTAGLMVAAVALPLNRMERQATALRTEIADVRMAADRARTLREEIEIVGRDTGFLNKRKRQTTPMTVVINELSRLLPDGTWLVDLHISGSRCEMSGYSSRSSALLARFEGSPTFERANFTTAVTQDIEMGVERFTLAVDLHSEEP